MAEPGVALQPAVRRFDSAKRVVIKVGSGVITRGGRLRPRVVARLAHEVTQLSERGHAVLLVVSGAVAAGYRALGLDKPPPAVVDRQAAASIGQYRLMAKLSRAFGVFGRRVAQLLLMEEDVETRRRFISARHTLLRLLEAGVIPIINENDPLSDDEAKIGDNDHLAAFVTSLVSADLLILLSTVPGIYENGSGRILPVVEVGSPVEQHITSEMSATGVGGMKAKVSAARLASRWGVPTIIADGNRAGILRSLVDGEQAGTLFLPGEGKINARKRWIAVRTRSRGALQVDDGARRAILQRGASVLPAGITAVSGKFPMGARVDIQDREGRTFAVGLSSYSADEVRRMQGRRRTDFKAVLGYEYVDEIIDRDDLVVLIDDDESEHPHA